MNARFSSLAVPAFAALLTLSACMDMTHLMGTGAERPAASEFGLGPRRGSSGTLTGTIATDTELATGRMQKVRLTVADEAGRPVDRALIDVDGGMPEHGHGLPTEPRVTRHLGGGTYLVEGLRFNMGGWWVIRFAVRSQAGNDTITFNVDL